jgi:hypothetical protein
MSSPHNRLKGPWFLFCAFIGLIACVDGVLRSTWWLAFLGLALLLGASVMYGLVRRGYNAWWMRSPLDRNGGKSSTHR